MDFLLMPIFTTLSDCIFRQTTAASTRPIIGLRIDFSMLLNDAETIGLRRGWSDALFGWDFFVLRLRDVLHLQGVYHLIYSPEGSSGGAPRR
jgi:hypothetical protein